ncbi:MAG: thymidylate synthase [Patescibacteria group bacterium]|nr:MAG: thymidylate synthase [Patescibacteria group bacterium]
MEQYLDVCRDIMGHGVDRDDRTGTGTRALFGIPMRFDLREGFPVITTKFVPFRLVLAELLWFLAGDSDVRNLKKLGCPIWNGNAYADYWTPKARFPGDAGRIYGVQWRSWQAVDGRTVDQLSEVIEKIENTPWDRRLIVTAWNPGETDQMCLPPCHMFFQFFVADGKLSLSMYQRSCDMFLGVPFNISSYALLLSLIAQITRLEPFEFVHILGDAHVYNNHFEQVRTQMEREPCRLPQLRIDPELNSLEAVVQRYRWILAKVDEGADPRELLDQVAHLEGYERHPAIKAPLAV